MPLGRSFRGFALISVACVLLFVWSCDQTSWMLNLPHQKLFIKNSSMDDPISRILAVFIHSTSANQNDSDRSVLSLSFGADNQSEILVGEKSTEVGLNGSWETEAAFDSTIPQWRDGSKDPTSTTPVPIAMQKYADMNDSLDSVIQSQYQKHFQEDDVTAHEDGVTAQEVDVTAHENGVTAYEYGVTTPEDDVTAHEDGVTAHETDVRAHENGVTEHEHDVTTHEDDVTANTYDVTAHDLRNINLREFQSAVDEEKRRLHVLEKAPGNASLPTVTTMSCPRLWAGDVDAEYLLKAASYRRSNTRSSRDILASTLNCTRYVLEQGFRLADVSTEEMSFPLAFSLMIYKDIEQVERLLRAVYRPHNVYCVHADQKSDEAFLSSLRLIVGCLPNVFVLERAIDVEWGQFSVLEPELECMRRLWSHAAMWRYFINLTGQEFPLKTNKELVTILKALKGANDITGTHDPLFNVRWNSASPAPFDLRASKGSVHVTASREFVDYVLHSSVSRDLQKWVRSTYIPDETFFSTLNHNPRLGVPGSFRGDMERRPEGEGSISRCKMWSTKQGDTCAGQWVRSVCVFGVGDLPRLTLSPHLIANKFFYDFQPLAYDCLEEWYFHKVHLENSGRPQFLNVSLYENLDIVKNRYTGRVQVA